MARLLAFAVALLLMWPAAADAHWLHMQDARNKLQWVTRGDEIQSCKRVSKHTIRCVLLYELSEPAPFPFETENPFPYYGWAMWRPGWTKVYVPWDRGRDGRGRVLQG